MKRSTSNAPLIKVEYDELLAGNSVYPDLFNSDKDGNGIEEYLAGADVLVLKGQVWPGMGKMDLANEEMRRTRNQRKPKSVIDKMKRVSEGIEPTQVVMTPQLVVERTKDVYDDSSSPIMGQEESVSIRLAHNLSTFLTIARHHLEKSPGQDVESKSRSPKFQQTYPDNVDQRHEAERALRKATGQSPFTIRMLPRI